MTALNNTPLNRQAIRFASATMALLLGVHVCTGANITQDDKLIAGDGAIGDWLGISVGVSGDITVVGAFKTDDNGDASGSAYIYRHSGGAWVEETKILPSDGFAGDRLGWSVAASGDVVVIGAPYDNDIGLDSGSVYVYRFDGATWNKEAKLHANDAYTDNLFGSSVSISGDAIVIGAPGDDDNGAASGSSYLFRWDGVSWGQEAKLLPGDGDADDRFGEAVSIDGDAIIVGAKRNDDAGSESGSAYLFRWNGASWAQEQKILAADAATGDWFGSSVAINGQAAIVGAMHDDTSALDTGSAYIFRWDGMNWSQEDQLLAADVAINDYFGASVGIKGDLAVIGAYQDDDNGDMSGSAYLFERNAATWSQQSKLLSSDGFDSDIFGISVAIDTAQAVVGAPCNESNGLESGAVYMFELCSLTADLNNDGAVDTADLGILLGVFGAAGPLADINNDGTVDTADLGILLGQFGLTCNPA